jgi:hypothetical protein
MNWHQKLMRNLKRRHLIISLAFAAAACGTCFYIFSSFGPIFKYWHIDLSFLILPFLGYYILRLASRLSGGLVRSFRGLAAANVLNGLAFGFLSYFILSQALLFTRLPVMGKAQNFLTDITHMTTAALLISGGYIIYSIARLLTETPRDRLISPAGSAVGVILMGCGVWQCLNCFSPSWPPAGGIGLIFLIAAVFMAFSDLGNYGQDVSNQILSDFSKWLKEGPTGKFFLGGFIAAYLIFVRPAIFSIFPYAFLVEWLVFCLISWRIFDSVKNFLRKRYSQPLKESGWQKHVQKVNDLTDEDFIKLAVLQKDYVETGTRRDLLEYLKQILVKNGLNEKEIGNTLRPIIEHSDIKSPWYCIGFLRRRFNRQNRHNRRLSLKDTMQNLNMIAYPSR